MNNTKSIDILGSRGIPANHGGFETFAERLAIYLTKKSWKVTVYCQDEGKGLSETEWNGIRLIRIGAGTNSPFATIKFDFLSTLHSCKENSLKLILGYNTAIFGIIHKIRGRIQIINMDGIEYLRPKWPWYAKIWFFINEKIACLIADHLIADHPEIKKHHQKFAPWKKISMIAYGGENVEQADEALLSKYDLEPQKYFLMIARSEPENLVLEIVRTFSKKKRGCKLIIVGPHDPERQKYHRRLKENASSEVIFLGSIYHKQTLAALRFFCLAYIHGYTVGGTNPSLVEAMGAGAMIIARENWFNVWVVGSAGLYFQSEEELEKHIEEIILKHADENGRSIIKKRFHEKFKWQQILEEYRQILYQHAV
ncbi:MAG: DUF1972 domain-containing protein [Candidatus Omnitrophota bacterium]